MEIKSIWDGWDKQLFGQLSDGEGGFCAMGFLGFVSCDEYSYNPSPRYKALKPRLTLVGNRIIELHRDRLDIEYDAAEEWIPAIQAIVQANNAELLTPEDFRRIDINCQMELIEG